MNRICATALSVVMTLACFGQQVSVDLGLSVEWAACNLGAASPEQYGDYYAWGETSPKAEFTWDAYSLGDVSSRTKYNSTDGLRVLSCADDAATMALGEEWRMPTKTEFEELLDKCTWVWNTRNGVSGYIVTGPNGNTIFLPAAGQYEQKMLNDAGAWGCYWSATRNHRSDLLAESLVFDSTLSNREVASRYIGQSIRPVRSSVSKSATNVPDQSSYVDLGLSVKWARCNLGARNPWDKGYFYAWGELRPRESEYFILHTYSWLTYKFGDKDFQTKYTKKDGKTVLDAQDDAATESCKSPWRLPTSDEFQELFDKCTWLWTSLYEVEGYKVTGPNGNYIFLPAAGYKKEREVVSRSSGFYWTSNSEFNHYAISFEFSSKGGGSHSNDRCFGLSVRPVFK